MMVDQEMTEDFRQQEWHLTKKDALLVRNHRSARDEWRGATWENVISYLASFGIVTSATLVFSMQLPSSNLSDSIEASLAETLKILRSSGHPAEGVFSSFGAIAAVLALSIALISTAANTSRGVPENLLLVDRVALARWTHLSQRLGIICTGVATSWSVLLVVGAESKGASSDQRFVSLVAIVGAIAVSMWSVLMIPPVSRRIDDEMQRVEQLKAIYALKKLHCNYETHARKKFTRRLNNMFIQTVVMGILIAVLDMLGLFAAFGITNTKVGHLGSDFWKLVVQYCLVMCGLFSLVSALLTGAISRSVMHRVSPSWWKEGRRVEMIFRVLSVTPVVIVASIPFWISMKLAWEKLDSQPDLAVVSWLFASILEILVGAWAFWIYWKATRKGSGPAASVVVALRRRLERKLELSQERRVELEILKGCDVHRRT